MLETGTVLQDRFLIEQELARGGMGAVYLATDQKFGSRVAIKERFYEQDELAAAFEREGRILNSLHHPILPHVSDYFSEGAGHFLVMEYIEGEDISEILKRDGAFPLSNVTKWTDELLDGLDYLHSQDPPIIHRDIKPGNLKLTSRGNIVLLDFGLAKETTGNTQGLRSVFGYSRRYSPLEQIEGAGTDARSDIFSLGATIFHLLTGEAPVDVLARASAIVAGKPDPLPLASEVNSEVPLALAEIIHRALALNPDQRFASVCEMREAFDSLGHIDETEDVTQVAISDPPAPVETFPALEAFADEISDTPEKDISEVAIPLVTPAAVSHIPAKRSSAAFRSRPVIQRPAVWAGIVVLALILLGYTQYRLNRSHLLSETAVQQSSNSESESPAPEQTAEAENAETEQIVQPAAPDTSSVAQKEVASVTETKPGKKEKRNNESVAVKRSNRDYDDEDEIFPDTPRPKVTRRETVPVTQQARRDRPRKVDVYEPPVSSIEMVLTGIPPERRRRRHWPPY